MRRFGIFNPPLYDLEGKRNRAVHDLEITSDAYYRAQRKASSHPPIPYTQAMRTRVLSTPSKGLPALPAKNRVTFDLATRRAPSVSRRTSSTPDFGTGGTGEDLRSDASPGQDPEWWTYSFMISVAAEGDLEQFKDLVLIGLNPRCRNDECLVVAAAGLHYELVEYLLSIGLDPRASDGAAFHRADVRMVQILNAAISSD